MRDTATTLKTLEAIHRAADILPDAQVSGIVFSAAHSYIMEQIDAGADPAALNLGQVPDECLNRHIFALLQRYALAQAGESVV